MGNLTLQLHKKTNLLLVSAFLCFLSFTNIDAQPTDLPWEVNAECESIVTDGIVAVTCGVLQLNPANENYTFGMIDLTGALPATGRIDVTASQGMYHHPSWLVDSIGNVFGITMDNCGYTYVTASSQYSSAYFGQNGVIRYGDIGGGAEDLAAAGTVYVIDAMTGQASVFAVLPQQAYSFINEPCEGGTSINRNTGPGLGNIVFSFEFNTFYVTNFEDGRIYRLDATGNILDSYDPLTYDNGASGIPAFDDMPYGLDISNDNTQLFFGTIGGGGSSGAKLYSIDLQADGSFPGTIDNTSLPAGATWDNYVDTEFEHFDFGQNFATNFISDIEFTPSGKLLVGNRIGCFNNLHTSYNHGGRSLLLEPDGSDVFNILTTIYVSNGIISDVNSYGGVSAYTPLAGGLDQFVISSADMLSEQGPHGICSQEEGVYGGPFGNPATPSAIISYLPGGVPFDVKGIGGDVHVFKECACTVTCPTDIEGDDMYVCSGDTFNLSYTIIEGNADTEATWTDSLGNVINPDSVVIDHSACAPGTYPFYVTAICLEDSTLTYTDTVIITAVTNDISPFVTASSDACSVDITIDSLCLDYITLMDTIPIINPGDSGTVCINVIQTSPISCDTLEICLDYDCPCDASCCPEAIMGIPLTVCSNDSFDLDFELVNGISNMIFSWEDLNGNTVDPNGLTINHTACAPGDYTYIVTAICEDDTSLVLMDTIDITVITDDISPFITTIEEPCEIDVVIDSSCLDYLEIIGDIPDIELGDSGTVCVLVVQTTPISCDTLEVCLNYDCPCDASCCPTNTQTFPLTVCSGDPFDLLVNVTGGISDTEIIWTDQSGTVVNPIDISIDHNACAPGEFTYYMNAICEDDTSVVLMDSVVITVITDDITPFFTVIEEPCEIDVIIDPNCVDHLQVIGSIPDISPGESGTVNLQVIQTSNTTCDLVTLSLDYDCPCDASCCPTNTQTFPLTVCSGDPFDLLVNVTGGIADNEIIWTDANGTVVNPVDVTIDHNICAPDDYTYYVNVICQEDTSLVLTDSVNITVITDDITPFFTVIEEPCEIDVIIDPECADHLQVIGNIPDINPGESGTVNLQVVQTSNSTCDVVNLSLEYDCPCDESCCPDELITEPLFLCSGDLFDLEVEVIGGSSDFDVSWTDINGNPVVPTDVFVNHADCAPGEYPFIVNVVCQDFPFTLTDTLIVTAVTDDISPFVTLVQEDCFIDVIIDPGCEQYLAVDGMIPDIMPGDSGTVSIDIIQTTSVTCDVFPVELSFDCDCNIDAVVVTESECLEDGTFTASINVSAINTSQSFEVFDQNGNSIGIFDYSDVPITLGPFQGDTTTIYNFTLEDIADTECNASFSIGPKGCPICGDCETPNAFTPDGDGINDFFSIICEGFANVTRFRIYDRWGLLIYDELEPWDGTYKGAPAPSDVYIFRIEWDTSCEIKEETGDVTLIR